MGSSITMSLSEIDSAIACNLMKWRRLTRGAALSDSDMRSESNSSALDPRWFDLEGHPMAIAEIMDPSERANVAVWSPTQRAADAQTVRAKLAEKYHSIILARLGIGAIVHFALYIDDAFHEDQTKSHLAVGATEEIATCLCALASVGIYAQVEDEAD